jgi:type II secretory pathway component PulF
MKKRDMQLLLSELQWLLQSGVDLLASLHLLKQQLTLKQSGPAIQQCIQAISAGQTLSQALAIYAPKTVLLFIRCGETSGDLGTSLSCLCAYLKSMQKFKQSILQAMLYPSILLIAAIILLGFMLLFIVPQFDALYQQFQAPLPASTQWLLSISQTLPYHLPGVILGLAGSILLLCYLWKNHVNCRELGEGFLLKIPVVGTAWHHYLQAKCLRSLHLLLRAGIPLTEALALLQETQAQIHLQRAFREIQQAIMRGQALHIALRQSRCFDSYCCDLVKLAEASGQLDRILDQLASYYDERLAQHLTTIKQLLQPAMVLLMGLLLAVWLLLLYYPLLHMGYAI